CLRSHRTSWVLSDQAWMPSPLYIIQKLDAATGPFGYVRLLGDRNEVDPWTKKLDRVVIDRQDQIHADAEAIKLLTKRVPVLAFVNNHFAGYAPETLRQLAEALGRIDGGAVASRCALQTIPSLAIPECLLSALQYLTHGPPDRGIL